MNPMQQKMLKHRQAAMERQRSAARNRLGVSVVAQANPLVQPPKKIPNWGAPPLEGELPTPAPAHKNSEGMTGCETQKLEDAVAPSSGIPSARTGVENPLDSIADCLAVEEIFDECIQAGPGIVVSAGAEEPHRGHGEQRQQRLLSPGRRGAGAALSPQVTPRQTPRSAALCSTSSTRTRDSNEAWGGAGAAQRGRGPRRAGGVCEEEVSDFNMPGPSEVLPRGGRRRPAPSSEQDEVQSLGSGRGKLQSWDLDIDAVEPEPAKEPEGAGVEGRRGRRWWKPWQGHGQQQDEARPGSRRADPVQEVTTVCNFSSE